MYDSLGSYAPGVRGFIDALAVEEPAAVSEIGRRMGLDLPTSLRLFADDLIWMGLIEQQADGLFVFQDPIFRCWVARANDPNLAPSGTFDPDAARRITRLY